LTLPRLAVVWSLHALLALFLLSLAWPDPDKLYTPDSQGYDVLATNLIAHQVFSVDSEDPFAPDAFRTPVYPLFLALCYVAFGHNPFVPVLIQFALNLAIIRIAYRLGATLFDCEVGYWGSALLALSGIFALHARYLLTETLFTFLLASVIYWLVWLIRSVEVARWGLGRRTGVPVAIGILLGLATLCRPNGFFFLGLVVLMVIALTRVGEMRERMRSGLIICACFALVISPWAARNWYYFGSTRLDTNQGYVLYYTVIGSMQAREQGLTLQEAMTIRRAQETEVDHLNAMELAAKRQGEAIKEIIDSPGRFAEVFLFGLAVTLSPISPQAVALYLGEGGVSASKVGEIGAIIRSGQLPEIVMFVSDSFESLQQGSIVFLSLFFLLLDLLKYWLCIVAVVLYSNRNRDRSSLYILLPIIAYFVLITGPLGPEATFRYRVPVDPYISLLAGAGFCGLRKTWAGFLDRRLLLSLLFFFLFCGVLGTLRLFFSVSMV